MAILISMLQTFGAALCGTLLVALIVRLSGSRKFNIRTAVAISLAAAIARAAEIEFSLPPAAHALVIGLSVAAGVLVSQALAKPSSAEA